MNQAEVLATVGSHVQQHLENHEPATAAKVKLMEAETIWKRFRAEHNLTHREANDKISAKRFFAPILLILIFEVVMYSNFYRDDNGLIGGFTKALAIAFLSLVIQISLGLGFRYHNLLKPTYKKIAGWLALVGFLLFIVWVNALLACYRLYYQLFLDNPLENTNPLQDAILAALNIFFHLRFPFTDIDSLIMIGLGIAFGILAFIHGYTMKDPYPDYQEINERKKEHQNEYNKQISQANPDKTIQKLVQELDDIIRQANSLHRISAIKEEILNKEETYKNLQTKTNEQLNAAISYFREHQLAIRATGMSAPSYFSNAAPTINFRVIPTDKLLQKIDDIHVKNQTLDARINQYVTPTLKMINTNKPQIAIEAKREFIKEVDKIAQERIHPVLR